MDVPVELITDDAWAAEYDKTCFFSVGVDSCESIIFVKTTIFLAHDVN